MRLRAYITPCMYFPAFLRSSPSAQKKTHDDISRKFRRIYKKREANTRAKHAETSRSSPATSACFLLIIYANNFAVIRNLCRENFGSKFARFCASEKRKFGQKKLALYRVVCHPHAHLRRTNARPHICKKNGGRGRGGGP